MDFDYFFFEPLSYEDFQKHSKINMLPKTMLSSYLSWITEYCRKAEYFYQYQYRRHSAITREAFGVLFRIPDYEHPENFGLDLEWKEWKQQHQLDEHYGRYQQAVYDLRDLKEKTDNKIQSLNLEQTDEVALDKDMNKAWFEKIIHNSPRIVEELKSLPYEKYRKSVHWQKARSAILLINGAACQAVACRVTGESWYGGTESEIEVHHLNYFNLGNEKFSDLALLCRRHHQLIHDNLENTGKMGIEIVTD